jgi:hypothetical protein
MRSFTFTADIYLSLFETYNNTIWPTQVVAYGLGILAVVMTLRPLAVGAASPSPFCPPGCRVHPLRYVGCAHGIWDSSK